MINDVTLMGNLTHDLELRYVGPNKTSVVNFTVAVNRPFTRKNGEKGQETQFIDCEAWDSGADTLAAYGEKGSPIFVRGSLKTDNWEKEGVKHKKMKVRVGNFRFLNSPKKNEIEGSAESFDGGQIQDGVVDNVDSDINF